MPPLNTQLRPRAYEPCPWQWSFHLIPATVSRDGATVPNPARDSAIFVVHGMGEQAYADTAVELRDGFENVIDRFGKSRGQSGVPAPFILDGYWANFDNFEDTFPRDVARMSAGQRTFFAKLWQRRGNSPGYAFRWFFWQGWRLLFSKELPKNYKWTDRIKSIPVVVASWIGLTIMWTRYRKILARVLGDVSLYASPNGAVKRTIVQGIERRVGEQFLLLLGLDWDFCTLSDQDCLHICGEPHRFTYVVWVAHSLGSVVSYNVVCDIFERAREIEQQLQDPACPWKHEQKEGLRANIEKVHKGLHRFITIGSPLQKFAVLFPEVLRKLPFSLRERLETEKRSQGGDEPPRRWWVNFFHVWDPVSGRLLDTTHFPGVVNLHSRLWRLPLWAHVSYWGDKEIQKHIVSRTYGRDIFCLSPESEPTHLPEKWVSFWRLMNSLLSLLLLGLMISLPIIVVAFPGQILAAVWRALQWWFALRIL